MDRRSRHPAATLLSAALTGVILACAATPVTSAAAVAAPKTPRTYAGSVVALGLQVVGDTIPPPIAIYDVPPGGYVAYGRGDLDNDGTARATAATFTPGPGLLGGISLLCSQLPGLLPFPLPSGVGCPSLPPYPLSSEARYPTQPDPPSATGWAGPGQPALLAVGHAAAHAHATSTATTVSTGRAALLTGAPGALSVGSAESSTSQLVTPIGITLSAHTTLTKIEIAGVLHLDTLSTATEASLQGAQPATEHSTVSVLGARLNGQPVSIDDSGVHLLGNKLGQGALAAANAALAGVLAGRGVVVRLVGSATDQAHGRTSAAGLLVSFDTVVAGVPAPPPVPCDPLHAGLPCLAIPSPNREYVGTALLGATGAVVASAPGLADVLGVLNQLGGPPSPALPVPGSPGQFVGLPSQQVAPSALTAAHPLTAPASAAQQAYTVLGLSPAALRLVYLSLIAGALGLFVASRLPHTAGWRNRRLRGGSGT